MRVKEFKGVLCKYVYIPGEFNIFQGVKKGRPPKSSRGVTRRSRGYGQGETVVHARFMVEVDLGVLEDHFDRWPPAIDIIGQLHLKWPRLTKNLHEALRATQPTYLMVEGHCSNDGDYSYTISQESVNEWVSEVELYLAQHK